MSMRLAQTTQNTRENIFKTASTLKGPSRDVSPRRAFRRCAAMLLSSPRFPVLQECASTLLCIRAALATQAIHFPGNYLPAAHISATPLIKPRPPPPATTFANFALPLDTPTYAYLCPVWAFLRGLVCSSLVLCFAFLSLSFIVFSHFLLFFLLRLSSNRSDF